MGKPIDSKWTPTELQMYYVIERAVDAILEFNTALDYILNTDETGHPLNSHSFVWPISDAQNPTVYRWRNRKRRQFLGED